MSRRPPNELETRLHQAALSASKKELTVKQAESIIPDASAREKALNFLLGVGLLKSLKDSKESLTAFRAVTKDELTATKDLSGEEHLVLSHIKSSGNEGIWTKHLKAKTNLHQTIIDRCLKTLVQKRLIKRVPSVQHKTRKIYMLESLEPSIALTGGPWYTDNELDTEFIQHLSGACLKFIRDISFPKRRAGKPEGALYGISNAPEYPTAQHIRNTLKKARLTETDLTVEHVEMLLNVLILDGEIEKIPAFGTSMWDSNALDNDESQDESERRLKKKRKRGLSSDGEDDSSKHKRSKPASDDDDDSGSNDTSSKKSKRKRIKNAADSDDNSDHARSRKRKKKNEESRSEEASSSSECEAALHKKKPKRKLKRPTASSDEEASSSDHPDHRSLRGKNSKHAKRSPSPFQSFGDFDSGGGYAYRAIKPECISLGWSESPCSQCPSFDFCKDGGPVNPRECVYYGDWLTTGTAGPMADVS